MINLIERLEKATGPDRELDRDIKIAQAAALIMAGVPVPEVQKSTAGGLFVEALPYTGSIDAALTLMPEGFTFYVDSGTNNGGDHCHACVWHPDPDNRRNSGGAKHATPAIALCIAALKARSHSAGK